MITGRISLSLPFMIFSAGDHRNMVDAMVGTEQQAERKALAHFFSQNAIANLEPRIYEYIDNLVKQVDRFTNTRGESL